MNINLEPEQTNSSDASSYDELGALIEQSELPAVEKLMLVSTLLHMKAEKHLAELVAPVLISQHVNAIQQRSVSVIKSPTKSSWSLRKTPGPKRIGNKTS